MELLETIVEGSRAAALGGTVWGCGDVRRLGGVLQEPVQLDALLLHSRECMSVDRRR